MAMAEGSFGLNLETGRLSGANSDQEVILSSSGAGEVVYDVISRYDNAHG